MWRRRRRRHACGARGRRQRGRPGDEPTPIGLALHDDNVTTRYHYVSMPLKLSIGTRDGHINAVELM
jgi:hypothetical protein